VNDAFRLYGPLLRLLPSELAHTLTIQALRLGLSPRATIPPDPVLACHIFGKQLPNPFGMAAGFDKDAEVIEPLLRLGFGFVEVGTVTPRAQPGNPRPRMFRLRAERAVINRMGFNNRGLAPLTRRMERFRAGPLGQAVVGINIGKNKTTVDAAADYVAGIEAASALADFLVVNISSPNTPGLRDLQGYEALVALLERVQNARGKLTRPAPLYVKIAPDLTRQDREDIARAVLDVNVDGLVVSNTTVARPAGLRGPARDETGGLSGPPLMTPSTELLRDMVRLTSGKLTFIGTGGVASGADAYAKIRAGATLVELYTALIYEGPSLVATMQSEIRALLARDGFASVSQAVGADHR
jgi:dihydroorotate dehydrogenase